MELRSIVNKSGYQIGKGRWPADWKNPNCPEALKKRQQVLTWMDALMDYGMCLDIPAWLTRNLDGQAATGICTYADAVAGTYLNNDYFINNRNGNCKFLNVLQGENHKEYEDWYSRMKKYCDPKQYGDRAFNGWAFGGQGACDVHLVLKRIIAMRFDGLLEKGQHDWAHFLGTSRLEWALLLTDIQRAVRKYHNPNFTISFDCASPFLATANGQVYTHNQFGDRGKWGYKMYPSVDDKKYHNDTRLYKEVLVQDGYFKKFETSPIIDQVQIKDVCIYGPGDLNKIGKEGKTSWDSFSYGILMGHNVHRHIEAVQEANRRYDTGETPYMLVQEQFDRTYFKDVVEAIFASSDRGIAEAIVDNFSKFWMQIPGTRGYFGKKSLNARTHYYNLFDEVETQVTEVVDGEFTEDQIELLDKMEEEEKNDDA